MNIINLSENVDKNEVKHSGWEMYKFQSTFLLKKINDDEAFVASAGHLVEKHLFDHPTTKEKQKNKKRKKQKKAEGEPGKMGKIILKKKEKEKRENDEYLCGWMCVFGAQWTWANADALEEWSCAHD